MKTQTLPGADCRVSDCCLRSWFRPRSRNPRMKEPCTLARRFVSRPCPADGASGRKGRRAEWRDPRRRRSSSSRRLTACSEEPTCSRCGVPAQPAEAAPSPASPLTTGVLPRSFSSQLYRGRQPIQLFKSVFKSESCIFQNSSDQAYPKTLWSSRSAFLFCFYNESWNFINRSEAEPERIAEFQLNVSSKQVKFSSLKGGG